MLMQLEHFSKEKKCSKSYEMGGIHQNFAVCSVYQDCPEPLYRYTKSLINLAVDNHTDNSVTVDLVN